ncbi:MAG: hypothetical protein GEU73_05035 [Chloroflexi bacterium]|nr:hypothetical protein [Chloroflexota bacterium]
MTNPVAAERIDLDKLEAVAEVGSKYGTGIFPTATILALIEAVRAAQRVKNCVARDMPTALNAMDDALLPFSTTSEVQTESALAESTKEGTDV